MEVQTIIRCTACREQNLVCMKVTPNPSNPSSTSMVFADFGNAENSENHYCIECEPMVVDCECGALLIVRSALKLGTNLQQVITVAAEQGGGG